MKGYGISNRGQKAVHGAPLKVFVTLALIWIALRLLWAGDAVVPEAQHSDGEGIPLLEQKRERLAKIATPSDIGLKSAEIASSWVLRRISLPTDRSNPRNPARPMPTRFLLNRVSGNQSEIPSQYPPPDRSVSRAPVFVAADSWPIFSPDSPTTNSARPKDRRLSLYAWAYGRRNGEATALGPVGTYGGSQAGLIVTYRIADTALGPLSAYARAASALGQTGEEQLAFGVKARPLKNIPFDLSLETRRDATNGRSSGIGVFVAGGLPPVRLPHEFTMETYLQTGAVIDERTRIFFDGAVTATRPIAKFHNIRMSAGGGLWASGQDDVRRVDVGPRLELRFPIGEKTQSVALDWRQRIAGSALPGSGPAITLAVQY